MWPLLSPVFLWGEVLGCPHIDLGGGGGECQGWGVPGGCQGDAGAGGCWDKGMLG